MPRIPRIPVREWSTEMREAMSGLAPANRRHPPAITKDRPKALDLLEVFAHHPALARAFMAFNGHLLYATTLSIRQRQTLILRVAVRRKADFIWAQHVFPARDAGMTHEELSRIAFGPDAHFLDPLEAALMRAVDEWIDEGRVLDETRKVLEAGLDAQQILDALFTVGCYDALGRAANALALTPDPAIPELMRKLDEAASASS